MCTAVTYKTKDFYFGRTLDYEYSYKEEITITPRNYKFNFKNKLLYFLHLLQYYLVTIINYKINDIIFFIVFFIFIPIFFC